MDVGEPEMAAGSRYIPVLVGCLTLALCLLAAFNIAVDPYKYMNTPLSEGFNARKTTIFYQLHITKSYAFRRSRTSNLLLGTSRAGRSIDTEHPSLADDNFYNFATPGSLPRLDYLKLQAAIDRGGIEQAIFFIDFFPFNTRAALPPGLTDAFEARLSKPTGARAMLQGLADFSAYFWSYQSLEDSVRTLQQQRAAQAGEINYTTLFDDGRWKLNFSTDRDVLKAFQGLERSYLRGSWFPYDDPTFSLREDDHADNTSFTDLSRLLQLAHANDVELKLVMLPVHARLLENLERAGLWQHFEYWKRRVVQINETVAGKANQSPFVIWDFNGYNAFSTEPVSTETTYTDLKWMHDSGHLTRAAGDRILEIVAAGQNSEEGAIITGESIDGWLAAQRQQQRDFRAKNPDTVRQVSRQVKRFRQRHPWQVAPISG